MDADGCQLAKLQSSGGRTRRPRAHTPDESSLAVDRMCSSSVDISATSDNMDCRDPCDRCVACRSSRTVYLECPIQHYMNALHLESSDQTSCFMPCSSMTGAVPTGAEGEQKVPLLSPYRFLAASRLNANAGIPCIANRHSRTICSCSRKHYSQQCAVRGFARCYDTVHRTRTRLF